ncbi:sigma-70 family RNA polymerase sigma factor [Luteolibacter arcticus]|uniref:Sigma-70 family RNA polymerase sigma factor n=1 Tax=Luteolibacter arcticus TaxID=1581411 RepID=A0ABT3GE49_9BACT|nr:sigma-70 family RNA polymerase sigma factor [Luteolibacter arcticus]MCW1921895.1 sigma-70 family RNA polymerase sigma factor [Luteolibacter arcticus]
MNPRPMSALSRNAAATPPGSAWLDLVPIRRAPWRIRLVHRLHGTEKNHGPLRDENPHLRQGVASPANSSPETAGLLARVASGDGRAMETCIDAFGSLVWGIVLKRVRDRTAAEDLVQEIFTDLWKHSGRHDPAIASETGFVAVVARRRVIDWLRRQSRLPQMGSLDESPELPAVTAAEGSGLDRETMWRALERLPEETRQLFRLHFEQGMSHGEISEHTGLPLGSVKTRLRRGLIEARALVARLGARVKPSTGGLS